MFELIIVLALRNQDIEHFIQGRIYTSLFLIFFNCSIGHSFVIVEDSNSGYQFFKNVFDQRGIPCIAAAGKSNICAEIEKTDAGSTVLIIADGAAFGPEMEKTLAQRRKRNIILFLPESFEWLILSSSLISDRETKQILHSPSDFIESREYFSWERFFTALLIGKTRDSYLRYNKKELNPVYLQDHEKSEIEKLLPLDSE